MFAFRQRIKTGNPPAGNQPQLNTNRLNTNKSNKNKEITKQENKSSTNVEDDYKRSRNVTQTKDHLPYEYTQSQFDEFIKNKVGEIINRNFPDEKGAIAPISDIISYFYKMYYEFMGERHPILKDTSYMSIILKLLDPIDNIVEFGYRLNTDVYKIMIDDFFEKEFGKKSGLAADYRISFFMSDGVLEKLCYKPKYILSI